MTVLHDIERKDESKPQRQNEWRKGVGADTCLVEGSDTEAVFLGKSRDCISLLADYDLSA